MVTLEDLLCVKTLWQTYKSGSYMTGDVQKDFWLAFDLLRNPKDHAEFTIVRDWVRDTLKVGRHAAFHADDHQAS